MLHYFPCKRLFFAIFLPLLILLKGVAHSTIFDITFCAYFLYFYFHFSTRSRKTVESEKVKWRQRVRQRPLFAAGCSAPGHHRTLCTLYMHKCTPGYHRKHIHHSAIQLNRQAWKSRLSDIFARLQHLHILLKFERRPFTALTKDTLPLKQQNSEHFFIRKSLEFPLCTYFDPQDSISSLGCPIKRLGERLNEKDGEVWGGGGWGEGECLPGLTFPEAACVALLRRGTLTLAWKTDFRLHKLTW